VTPEIKKVFDLVNGADAKFGEGRAMLASARALLLAVSLPSVSTFSVKPSPVAAGKPVTVAWTTKNGDSATLSGPGLPEVSVPLSGTQVVAAPATGSYTLTVVGQGGTTVLSTQLVVTAPPSPPSPPVVPPSPPVVPPSPPVVPPSPPVVPPSPPVVPPSPPVVPPPPIPAPTGTLTVSKQLINQGESTVLTWTTVNANHVELSGVDVNQSGSLTVSPLVTTTYTLLAAGPGGTAQASLTVTVLAIPVGPPSPPVVPPSPPVVVPAPPLPAPRDFIVVSHDDGTPILDEHTGLPAIKIPNFGNNPTVVAVASGDWSNADTWAGLMSGSARGVKPPAE
jgi:hypothetical protein